MHELTGGDRDYGQQHLLGVLHVLFISPSNSHVKYCLLYIFVLSFLYELLSISVMFTISSIYESVTSANNILFYRIVLISLFIYSFIALIKSYKTYYTELLALYMRITLVELLYTNKLINDNNKYLDNLDQRLSQDIDELTSLLSKLFENINILPLIILFYTCYLYYICGYIAPLLCYIYMVIGVTISYSYSKKIINLVYLQEFHEGNFRKWQNNFLLHAEIIVLLKSIQYEVDRVIMKFHHLVDNKSLLIHNRLLLSIIVNWFNYIGSIVGYVVVGISLFVFNKSKDHSESSLSGKLANGSYASLYLISAFSTILQSIDYVVTCKGLSKRVMEVRQNNLLCNYGNDSSSSADSSKKPPKSKNEMTNIVKITNLNVFSPRNRHILIKDLSIIINHGMRLLITGRSGCGKSTLLKLMADALANGNHTNGHVTFCCPEKDVYFCSQSPYLFAGTLVENVAYNHISDMTSNQDVWRVLSQVQFHHDYAGTDPSDSSINNDNGCYNNSLNDNVRSPLLSSNDGNDTVLHHDVSMDWRSILSYGEKQKLSIARILYNQPKVLFADECTSSIDEDEESHIYNLLTQQIPTIISVGHRTTIKKFHTHELHINNDGTYNITVLPCN